MILTSAAVLQNDYYNFGGTLERTEPKVNHNEPPAKPPKKPKAGNYCFRAYTSMTENNETMSEFTGYDNTMAIVDRVEHYCELNRTNKPLATCNPTKLAFIGDSDDMCDGRVLMYDKRNDLTRTFY